MPTNQRKATNLGSLASQSALNQGIEGRAVINFMVDPEGNTYEIEATGFGGHKIFHQGRSSSRSTTQIPASQGQRQTDSRRSFGVGQIWDQRARPWSPPDFCTQLSKIHASSRSARRRSHSKALLTAPQQF